VVKNLFLDKNYSPILFSNLSTFPELEKSATNSMRFIPIINGMVFRFLWRGALISSSMSPFGICSSWVLPELEKKSSKYRHRLVCT